MNINFSSTASDLQIQTLKLFQVTSTPIEASQETDNTGSATDVVDISDAAKAMQAENPIFYLSKEETLEFWNTILNLGEEDVALFYEMVKSMDQEELTQMLDATGNAGDLAPGLVKTAFLLEPADRQLFFKVSSKAADELENLISWAARAGNEVRQNFLNTAMELNAGDLENFITASVKANDTDLGNMINLSRELEKEDLTDFLTAAANAGKNLNVFLELSQKAIAGNDTRFLGTAAKSGTKLSVFMTLHENLSGFKLNKFYSFASMLSNEQMPDFLSAAKKNGINIDDLMAFTARLGFEDRTLFLSLASDTSDVADLIKSGDLLKNGVDLHNFLVTANNDHGNAERLMKMVTRLGGEDRNAMLSFVKDLSAIDLENFIQAGEKYETSIQQTIEVARELDTQNRSLFLYAAAEHTLNDKFYELTNMLTGEEQNNFLVAAANSEAEDGLNDLVLQTRKLDGQFRTSFLEQAVMNSTVDLEYGVEDADQYIYLISALDDDEQKKFQAAMSGISREEERELFISRLGETPDRKKFLSVAAKSGAHVNKLVNVTRDMSEESEEDLLNGFDNYSSAGIQNFLIAAESLSIGEVENLMDFADRLGMLYRDNFLDVASTAGKELDSLMDTVERLGLVNRSNFLSAAESAAASGDLKLLLDTTNHIIGVRVDGGGEKGISADALIDRGKRASKFVSNVITVFSWNMDRDTMRSYMMTWP